MSQHNFPKQKTGASTSPGKKTKTWYKFKEIKTFGDPIRTKNNKNFRIYFENADGLPTMEKSKYQWKYKKIKNLLKTMECDVTGLAETKVNWNLISSKYRIDQQMKGSEEYNILTSHNKNEQFMSYQQGGTALITKSWMNSFIVENKNNHTGL